MISPAVIQRKKVHAVWEPAVKISPAGFHQLRATCCLSDARKEAQEASLPVMTVGPNSLKSYLFECCVVMNSAILRGEAGPLKNFAVLLSHETVRNFTARRGPAILADVVKAISQFTP